MSDAPTATRSADSIDRHPPERRRRANESMVVYMCSCSCCCCCLHTVGGTLGVFVAGGFKGKDGYPSAQGVFWRSLLITVGLVAIVVFAFARGPVPRSMLMLGGSLVIAGPLFLLGASLLMFLWLLFRSDLPAEAQYWRIWGRITVYMIIGSVLGLAAMYIAYLTVSRR